MGTLLQQVSIAKKSLQITYGIVPIVAGIDKFTNLLVNWKDYLGPSITKMLPFSPGTFMSIVGVIEIIAGILVLRIPRIGAYVVAIWLVVISLTLITGTHYFDVAVRDLVMAAGAFALARLSAVYNPAPAR
jgi:uncharacterized membrane protein YphA (DoxX/SURF4 family)